MKHLKAILNYTGSLSENRRKILAVIATGVAAAIVFSVWGISIPKRLASISLPENKPSEVRVSQEEDALSPLAGITESFKAVERFLPSKESASAGSEGVLRNLKQKAYQTTDYIAEISERAAEFIYLKLGKYLTFGF